MRWLRFRYAFAASTALTAAIVFPEACASPTHIVVEVSASPELCGDGGLRLSQVGIAVGTRAEIDDPNSTPLQVLTIGCKSKATGDVGTLTITPRDDRNAVVAVRVVASLNDQSVKRCDSTDGTLFKNCIIMMRLVQFVEGEAVRVLIVIEPECYGVECPAGLYCVKGGKCAPPEASQNPTPPTIDATAPGDATTIDEPISCPDGGAPITEACSTSFSRDVLPALLPRCVTCHGGSQQPKITSDAKATWKSLSKFFAKNGQPLINPCSKDINRSTFVQTIDPEALTTVPLMPPPPDGGSSGGMPFVTVSLVRKWIECGAPNN